ncbi:hypothetical protein Patl1_26186 [Pistacia atlantica]|uniref:Uncharacterized protein n=1 Tax=Pistacia atlantica TaxID=434234 RepID=A0ACC1B2X6_9ROSI|nr:hypothetical protein Patl1_26186 [Pistacia atlantica]
MHWMRGELVIVTNVLEKTSGLKLQYTFLWLLICASRGMPPTGPIPLPEGIDVAASHPLITSGVAIGLGSVDWSVELEEVFSLEREGEFDKNAPLACQGWRIAHPEAPTTGYMVLSLSRCFLARGYTLVTLSVKVLGIATLIRKILWGLMLFSEVVLGEVYMVKNAEVKLLCASGRWRMGGSSGDAHKNVFDLGAFVGDLTFGEDASG